MCLTSYDEFGVKTLSSASMLSCCCEGDSLANGSRAVPFRVANGLRRNLLRFDAISPLRSDDPSPHNYRLPGRQYRWCFKREAVALDILMAAARKQESSYPTFSFQDVKETIPGIDVKSLTDTALKKLIKSRLGGRDYNALPASELAEMTRLGSGEMAIKLVAKLLDSELIRPVNENTVNHIGRLLVDNGFDRTSPLIISLRNDGRSRVRAIFWIHLYLFRVGEVGTSHT